MKDIIGVVVFLIVFVAILFFAPEIGGYILAANNLILADPLNTPVHIASVGYFTPFYILRAIALIFGDQLPGVMPMGIAVIIFLLLLGRSPVKSIRSRGKSRERDEAQGTRSAATQDHQGDWRESEHRATQRFARVAIYSGFLKIAVTLLATEFYT